ncbi:MAG: oxidative damage protection protein [Porticoccaceae bacterium]|jgi:Fe-S cluster biosynthesis and repair protein YggX|nr:oxidative damage protection protein [Porticoccaceae bacterium]MEA3300773.1 oxidative damage protection protein [Pseudomonadota bacterium]HLS99200.1 oxidative damage protection protein [Porticoccaceae bacterium]
MARTVFCRKLKQELPGLDQPPFPGPKGEDIFANISRDAWQQWLDHQTMLINEKRLNLMDLGTRTYLNEQRERFLSGEAYDKAEGYIPPDK